MTVLNLQVGAGADDAYERRSSGATILIGIYSVMGNYNIETDGGHRWTGVSGLSGATINGATLNFPFAHFSDTGPFVGDWYAQDAEAPATFTTATNDLTGRPRTTTTCEGDGSDFGDWTAGDNSGAGWDFIGDGTNTIAGIIQELADSYDPSAIVLIYIWASGSGERVARSYNYDSTYGAKLDITYTAGGATQTLTAPATIAEVGMTAAALAPDTATVAAPVTRVDTEVPTAALAGVGTATLVAPATSADAVATAHALTVQGAATLTATEAAVTAVVPTAIVSTDEVQSALAGPAAVSAVVPTPTLVGAGTVTLAAPATPAEVGMVSATLAPDTATLTAPATTAVDVATSAGLLIPRTTTLTAPALGVNAVVPEAIMAGGGVDLGFEPWGDITQWIDPDQCAPGTSFVLHAAIFTSSALNTVTARLFDIAAGVEVDGSRATSTSTTLGIARSGAFTNGLTSGLREYRLDYGGESGAVVFCQGGEVRGISS